MVINNAAIVAGNGRKTDRGLDEMFMVNYLAAYYLLRCMLARNLLNTTGAEPPRIVIVGSESHRDPKTIDWAKFGAFEDYTMKGTVALYGYYKLLLLTFARELARRLNSAEVTVPVYALCPGPVNSNIAREAPRIVQPLLKIVFGLFFRSPGAACEPVVYLSASPDVRAKPFDYLFLMQRKAIDVKADDEENGRLIWERSEALLNEIGVSLD